MFRVMLLILMLHSFSETVRAEQVTALPRVSLSQTERSQKTVDLYFFWSHQCPHCLAARPFVEELAQKYAWLKVYPYDLLENQDNVKRYLAMSKPISSQPHGVPAFIFCGQLQVGFDNAENSGKALENQLLACHKNGIPTSAPTTPSLNTIHIPLLGNIQPQALSLPLFTLIIASLDAFNPCAFFVLCFLLSLMTHSQERWRIAIIGGTFVLFSGLLYFLFMAAWLNVFLYTQQVQLMTALAGIIAMIIGLINIKDYFFFQQGLSLSIPATAKPKLFQRMRTLVQTANLPLMLSATAVLAIVANSYELLCTAGFPMVYTRVLTLNALSGGAYYGYLALYNVIYCVPLLVIVMIFMRTLGSRKLTEKEGRFLKLLSGNLMLGLGGLLFFAPQFLNSLLASVWLMAIAVFVSLLATI